MPLPTLEALRPHAILAEQITAAHKAGYELLKVLDSISDWQQNKVFQVATSESLTAGLIFSTLVDIPIGGSHKYGAFAVYDTAATRVFNGVTAKNVYTHKCAKEMAVGILKNSNASIAIAVTGNAMPYQSDLENMKQLGEVYIGIAGYVVNSNGKVSIKVRTKLFNACNESKFPRVCSIWYDSVHQEQELKTFIEKVQDPKPTPEFLSFIGRLLDGYADPELTSLMSNYIRQYTVEKALLECTDFLETYKEILTVPYFITEEFRVKYYETIVRLGNDNLTNNKYLQRPDLFVECENKQCELERNLSTNSQLLYSSNKKRNNTKKKKNNMFTNTNIQNGSISITGAPSAVQFESSSLSASGKINANYRISGSKNTPAKSTWNQSMLPSITQSTL